MTHLTEADQEASDEFDENLNTIKHPSKKNSRLVKPSEMLGNQTLRHAKGPLSKQMESSINSASRLSSLLVKRDKP